VVCFVSDYFRLLVGKARAENPADPKVQLDFTKFPVETVKVRNILAVRPCPKTIFKIPDLQLTKF